MKLTRRMGILAAIVVIVVATLLITAVSVKAVPVTDPIPRLLALL